MRQAFRSGIVILLMSVAFVAGFIMRGDSADPVQAEAIEFNLLKQVHGLVDENFVRELPESSTLEYAAIRGYLSSLNDRYTFFNEPPVASSESDALAGRYGGIGVDVRRNEAGLIVLYPYADSPAQQAGVLDGDILLLVNNEPLDINSSLDEVRQAMRGEITDDGAGVQITVQQPGATDTRIYDIAFGEIRIPSVVWRVLAEDPSLGYVHVTSFTSLTPDEVREAVIDLQSQDVRGLVLDLRNNSGGLLQESIQVADEFLNAGVIVRDQSRRSGETIYEAETDSVAGDIPLIVLVNGRTASAAEVVAGAIQGNDRALLVGQRTLGKGSVQFIFRLDDGSSIHVTSSLWLTPDEQPLDGIGLSPDVEMIPDANNRDVELGEAIRRLQLTLIEVE